jgi:NB-ARC domain
MHRFREIASVRDALKLREEDGNKLAKLRPLNPTSSVPIGHLHGRARDKNKLIEWLKSNDVSDGTYSVKTIVGMAGIGKTTLVQHVYHADIIQSNFDLKIWVYVSQQYNVVEVMRKIIESIENTSSNLSELESLHRTVIDHLRDKIFLLVLDDMWDEDLGHWSSLQAALNYGAKGSKVVVTTRSMKVGRIMCTKSCGSHLSCLSDDSSWLVCLKRICQGRETKLDNNMIEIGKKIVSRCKGLPLAAEAVGVSLSFCLEEKHWNRVLKNFLLTEDDQVSKILPALRVSYDFLPLHLKRCFTYCSLFPKGYIFQKNMLVHLWMAQGFINTKGLSSLEEVGCKYFDDLLDRCFLQHSPSHYSTEEMYVMHDLYHELAEDVSGEEFNRSEEYKVQKLHERVRHSSVVPQELGKIEAELSCFGGRVLRSFLLVGEKKSEGIPICMKISRGLFGSLDCLRALDLCNADIENLPNSIGNLIHLRYLSFQNSRIRCLPESISSLFNLQTLNLRECFYLEELPKGMKLLDNLRHLYLPLSKGCNILMPYGMGQMTSLQTLPLYVVGCEREGCGIEELGLLKNLKGEMHISGINGINDPQFAEDANMQDKGEVHKLTLDWIPADSSFHWDGDLASEVLARLKPHSNLEELIIMGFCGTQFPSWLSDRYLQKLSTLELKCCENAERLPSLGLLPSLKHLSIQFMAKLRRIDYIFCGHVKNSSSINQCHRGFPKLETLVFKKMDAWKEWDGVEKGDFPYLKYLTLNECNALIKWPQFPASVNVKYKRCSLFKAKGSEPLCLRLRNAEMSHVYPLLVLSECGNRFEETIIPHQVTMEKLDLSYHLVLLCSNVMLNFENY